jgi:hypothetical protein
MTKRAHPKPTALASLPPARKGPIVIVPWEPATERAVVLMRAMLLTLGSTFATAIGITVAAIAAPGLRWGLLGTAVLVGLTPLLWHGLRTRRAHRLPTWELTPKLAQQVVLAADQADRLRRMAERSPDGPIADHLAQLAATAEGYVVALHGAATQASLAGGDPDLEREMTRVVGQLTDLAEAAQRLRQAQKHHLEVSPLEELTEATERLAAAIESGGGTIGS